MSRCLLTVVYRIYLYEERKGYWERFKRGGKRG